MASHYTIQVSNHPEAGSRIPTEAGEKSWTTIFDSLMSSAEDARAAVGLAAATYRNVRAFRGLNGRVWYAILDTRTEAPVVVAAHFCPGCREIHPAPYCPFEEGV